MKKRVVRSQSCNKLQNSVLSVVDILNMSGFGVVCPWKYGVLTHGGHRRPKETRPKSELVYHSFGLENEARTEIDLAKDCEPVCLSHHAGCVVKV